MCAWRAVRVQGGACACSACAVRGAVRVQRVCSAWSSARAARVQCLLVQRVAVGQHGEEGGCGQSAQHRCHDVEHLEEAVVVVEVGLGLRAWDSGFKPSGFGLRASGLGLGLGLGWRRRYTERVQGPRPTAVRRAARPPAP